jgi:hypothetical protein
MVGNVEESLPWGCCGVQARAWRSEQVDQGETNFKRINAGDPRLEDGASAECMVMARVVSDLRPSALLGKRKQDKTDRADHAIRAEPMEAPISELRRSCRERVRQASKNYR